MSSLEIVSLKVTTHPLFFLKHFQLSIKHQIPLQQKFPCDPLSSPYFLNTSFFSFNLKGTIVDFNYFNTHLS